MTHLIRFIPVLFKQLIIHGISGLVLTLICFLPGYLISLPICYFLTDEWHRIAIVVGGISASLLIVPLGRKHLMATQDLPAGTTVRKSLKGSGGATSMAGQMIVVLIVLTLATYCTLVALIPWEPSLHLYLGDDLPTPWSVGLFVLDNLCRGLFIDVFEIFHIQLGRLEHNPKNLVISFYLVVFRFLAAGLMLRSLYLHYRDFREWNQLSKAEQEAAFQQDLTELFETIEKSKLKPEE